MPSLWLPIPIFQDLPIVEAVLQPRRQTIGEPFAAYRNHVYRVLHFCFAFHPCQQEDDLTKLSLAAAFHDLGLWPGDEIDYLAPSIRLAEEYLVDIGCVEWSDEIRQMIDLHHRFRRAPAHAPPLVEVFRKGDWVDATMGLRSFGLPSREIRRVQDAFPNLGFHDYLLRVALREFWNRPLNPLPMMRW